MDNYWTMATALMTALLVTMKCWENCQLLQSNFPVWGAICDEKGICFPGCKEACQFHVESEVGQRVPVIQTPRGEGVIRVSGGVASWPKPPRSHGGGPYVYVLMRRVGERPWRQISQGLATSARVPEGGTLRVLVVDRNGLVTIYSPSASGSGRLEEARRVLESVGRTDLLGPVQSPPQPGKRINTEIALPTTSLPSAILEDSRRTGPRRSGWTLREVSLIHQKVLVIAEIAWEARGGLAPAAVSSPLPGQRRPLYFVFWEVDGGGLSGNLFTDSTSVTLSLWPDTVYHIQVDLVVKQPGGGGTVITSSSSSGSGSQSQQQQHDTSRIVSLERSEELVVDTSRAVGVEWETPGLQQQQSSQQQSADGPRREPARELLRGHELALGIASALAAFAFLLAGLALVVSARQRRRPPPGKVHHPSPPPTSAIARVFPPKVCVGLLSEEGLASDWTTDEKLPRSTLHV